MASSSESLSVLFVDDEPAMRRIAKYALEQFDMVVGVAASLAEAKHLCSQMRFDAAVIDIWLEDGCGFELLAWLQEHNAVLARRTVFITGDVDDGTDVRRRLQAGGRPVLAKPFDLRELERLLRELAERPSGSVPALGTGSLPVPGERRSIRQ